MCGDPFYKPSPNLGPLLKAPFYAVELKRIGGSAIPSAGLLIDPHARCLGWDGKPIPGLYAVGTDMASIMGGFYPSGGINLGPAMTFGYIAGRHAAGCRPAREARAAAGRGVA